MEKSKKFTYQEMIGELQVRTGMSYHKVRKSLKELSRLLNKKIEQGLAVECDGLFKVDFTITGYTNMNQTYFDSEQQASELSVLLNQDKITTRNLIRNYYSLIKAKVEQGFQANIKSVAYLTPRLDTEGMLYISSRMSPQLKKPVVAEFVVLTKDGNIFSEVFEQSDVRLALYIEQLNIPSRIVKDSEEEVEYL